MSIFLPNIPQPNDSLDFSQGQLLSNNQGLDTVFGVDHYAFSDATVSKGMHNKVTTPLIVGAVHPTTATNPVIYGMQDSALLGVLQYSRGLNNAVPTPLTSLHSSSTPIVLAPSATTDIFDFTGLSLAYGSLVVVNQNTVGSGLLRLLTYEFIFGPASGLIAAPILLGNSGLVVVPVGNVLKIQNITAGVFSDVYWTMQFQRIQA